MNKAQVQSRLPELRSKAIAWAQQQCQQIVQLGKPLSTFEIDLAKSVGVTRPERVRVLEVVQMPMPEDVALREAATLLGLLGPTMVGITLGYGICMVKGHRTSGLLAHELRHVFQYEHAGSIEDFLPGYLEQLLLYGYRNAPLEQDACLYERA